MELTGPIPADAVEVVLETYESGDKQKTVYFVDGKEIGYRFWNPSGTLAMEYGYQDGLMHGLYREWHDNGQLCQISTYIQGKEHGETKQFDENGVQIGSYVMDHGTGVDLWSCCAGVLSEEREYRDGQRHGYERWWAYDNRTVYEESHFWNGQEHGIFRAWNRHNKLRRGYPRYYIRGERVDKRRYMRACRTDPTLPPFVSEDNQPFRPLPPGFTPADAPPNL